jgi:hypothetical protein
MIFKSESKDKTEMEVVRDDRKTDGSSEKTDCLEVDYLKIKILDKHE